jgi:hypothetical protein
MHTNAITIFPSKAGFGFAEHDLCPAGLDQFADGHARGSALCQTDRPARLSSIRAYGFAAA